MRPVSPFSPCPPPPCAWLVHLPPPPRLNGELVYLANTSLLAASITNWTRSKTKSDTAR